MTKLKLLAGAAALGLLAGCGEESAPVANIVTVETGNAAVMVPEGNAAEPANAGEGNAVEAAPALNLAPDGLTVVTGSGSARHARFGMKRDVAVPLVSAALGRPEGTGRNDECGQGPMETVDFRHGLTLFFQGGFVGWDLDGRDRPAYATAAGIGIGSTLRQLREVMRVTVETGSLGDEFMAGDLGGLLTGLTPDATVTHLWAGSTCRFR